MPKLQPLTVINGQAPWAAWAFDARYPAGNIGTDRSGNLRDLSYSTAIVGSASRRGSGHTSALWYGSAAGDFSMSRANLWDAGDLTICGWLNTAWVSGSLIEGWWFGFGQGAGGNQCLLGNTAGPNYKLLYVADPSGGVTSTMGFPGTGDWRFVSVRRSVSLQWVRWGIDTVFEQKTIGPPAAASAGSILRVGCMPFAPPNFCAFGAMEDWVYWKTLLTDDQVLAQRSASL